MKAFQDYYPDKFSHCFGCGKSNADGHHLKSYWYGDNETIAHFKPEMKYSGGFPGYVYGGMIASLLDCHGTATAAAAAFRADNRNMGDGLPAIRCVTASLKVDYLRPTPQDIELSIHGKIREVTGKKIWVDLSLMAGDIVCATGEMLAVRLPEDETSLSLA